MSDNVLIFIKMYVIMHSQTMKGEVKMESVVSKILELVEQILSYFNEVDASAVVEMVKEFLANLGL